MKKEKDMARQSTKKAPARTLAKKASKKKRTAQKTPSKRAASTRNRTFTIDMSAYGICGMGCVYVGPKKPTKEMVNKAVTAITREMLNGLFNTKGH